MRIFSKFEASYPKNVFFSKFFWKVKNVWNDEKILFSRKNRKNFFGVFWLFLQQVSVKKDQKILCFYLFFPAQTCQYVVQLIGDDYIYLYRGWFDDRGRGCNEIVSRNFEQYFVEGCDISIFECLWSISSICFWWV